MAKKTDVCIVIDGNGFFRSLDKTELKIVIPYTEESAARVGEDEPHPLHDDLNNLAMSEKKREKYLERLKEWGGDNKKLLAVYKYISGATILDDLLRYKIKTESKLFVRFSVEIGCDAEVVGDKIPNLWEDSDISAKWQEYYEASQQRSKIMCYVSGEIKTPVQKHLRGINTSTNGAKLISGNDDVNYTFRGHFTESYQANSIGFDVSHKAHAMLNYLIETQGYKCDTQAVVAWAIDDGKQQLDPFASTVDLTGVEVCAGDAEFGDENAALNDDREEIDSFDEMSFYDHANDEGQTVTASARIARRYAQKIRNALSGTGNKDELCELKPDRVAVIAVDAATTGRMSVTFYQELAENEYLERIINWHETCSWWFRHKSYDYISAPSVNKIIEAVYGEPKGDRSSKTHKQEQEQGSQMDDENGEGKGAGYKKIQKQARERMLHVIICGEQIDRSWVSAAVCRVSNPFSYANDDEGWDKRNWEYATNVVCAIVRKYYLQKKEEIKLELDTSCKDRSYLFGRLLALADQIESHALFLQSGNDETEKQSTNSVENKTEPSSKTKKGKNDTEKHPTNAVRYMPAFSSRPLRTWEIIFKQLNSYIQRLNGAVWYQNQIDEIMSLFDEADINDNPLNGKYLIGYSLQRRALRKRED
jgi:CRISPR-associated protein Csd1